MRNMPKSSETVRILSRPSNEILKKGEYLGVLFFAGEKEVAKVRDWAKNWVLLGKWLMPAFAVVFVISYFLYYL